MQSSPRFAALVRNVFVRFVREETHSCHFRRVFRVFQRSIAFCANLSFSECFFCRETRIAATAVCRDPHPRLQYLFWRFVFLM